MLSVAICDDEPAVCREIEELLAGQLVRADLDGNTRVFSDGESLVRAYERGEADFQIVFLDIKMQAMNGISAAREIRRYDEKVLIVFITSSAEYVFRGYEVKAFRYILKTELHQAFRKIFEECMEELRADSLRRFSFRRVVYRPLRGAVLCAFRLFRDMATGSCPHRRACPANRFYGPCLSCRCGGNLADVQTAAA